MFLQNSQRKIEEEFLKLTEKRGADREPLRRFVRNWMGAAETWVWR